MGDSFYIWIIGIILAGLLYVFPLGYTGYLMLRRFGRGGEGILNALLFGPLGLVMCWVERDNAFRDAEDRLRQQHERAAHSIASESPRARAEFERAFR